jgi:phage baseplate assembly protein W
MDQYIGFSTLEFQNNKNLILKNANLIKQDLINNIFTKKGERVMMTTYGTRIPDLVFEPLDDATVYIVQQDITQVFDNDPRVTLKALSVIPLYDKSTIMVFADVYYTYLNFSDKLDLNIKFVDA